jgi:outer membrane murein-binding lipoprotein Lpp
MACFSCNDDLHSLDGSEIAQTIECDYDVNPTALYQALESKEWEAALEFLQTGHWNDGGIFGSSPRVDPLSPARQAKTWVTRYEEDGSVRWSQLPLHAAIIFKAPSSIVMKIVELYPQGSRCTDDQHMLPLHLGFKFGSDDKILAKLIEDFPEAMTTKDIKGRYPLQVDGPRKDFKIVLEAFVSQAEEKCQKELDINIDNVEAFKESIELKDKLLDSMESHNQELETAYAKLEQENEKLQQEIKSMKKMLARAEKKLGDTNTSTEEKRDGVSRNDVRGRERKPRLRTEVRYNSEMIDSSFSKEPIRSAKSTKLPRRGFFKGFGAKE